jgi:hypothetical protein
MGVHGKKDRQEPPDQGTDGQIDTPRVNPYFFQRIYTPYVTQSCGCTALYIHTYYGVFVLWTMVHHNLFDWIHTHIYIYVY